MKLAYFRFTAQNAVGLLNMEWAGKGGSGPGIIFGILDNYIGVTEEKHDNQINLRGFGAAIWSRCSQLQASYVLITKLLQQTSE
jgi:hypothetical protein